MRFFLSLRFFKTSMLVVFLVNAFSSSFAQDDVDIDYNALMQGKLSAMMKGQSVEDMDKEEEMLIAMLASGSCETALEAVGSFFAGSVVEKVEDKTKIAIAASLDVTTALFTEKEIRKAKKEVQRMKEEQKQIKIDRAIVATTTAIYEGYQTLMSYVEQISEAYQTFTYAKRVYEDIQEAALAYQKISFDGVIHINTLYDLDKWLNPYQKRMRREYLVSYLDRLDNIAKLLKKILAPVSEGGFRAGDSWRMNKLEELDLELRSMISGIYRMHRWCMAHVSRNRTIAVGIIVDKSCWDFGSYHYRGDYKKMNDEGWKFVYNKTDEEVESGINSISQ